MYLLTLQFDSDKTNGRFSGDSNSTSGPLSTSMNWLRLIPDAAHPEPDFPVPSGFNVETANWQNLGKAGTLFLPGPDPQVIGVYVRQDPDANAGPALDGVATVQLVVCFGRPTKAHQEQASPFTENAAPLPGGLVQTNFVIGPIRRNSPPTGTALSWFFPLHKIAIRPTNPNLTHRFEFSLGLTVRDVTNARNRYYGEDPEMDIGP